MSRRHLRETPSQCQSDPDRHCHCTDPSRSVANTIVPMKYAYAPSEAHWRGSALSLARPRPLAPLFHCSLKKHKFDLGVLPTLCIDFLFAYSTAQVEEQKVCRPEGVPVARRIWLGLARDGKSTVMGSFFPSDNAACAASCRRNLTAFVPSCRSLRHVSRSTQHTCLGSLSC